MKKDVDYLSSAINVTVAVLLAVLFERFIEHRQVTVWDLLVITVTVIVIQIMLRVLESRKSKPNGDK